ncbi:MAG TPA: ABC transporter ATP-binding protein [Burkholderiaceae bacterium]|nr:ABC transporter ATP-binding protein [Burkholderiaceae bacterium]HQR70703.1 ABC transporter ATP-binding protein [Burkholderiaceae bacterium]
MTARLALRGISKRFGETIANDSISLEVMPGEIVAVLGENGAGKSTLMKIIYGVVRPDQGRILVDGREVVIDSPARARALGISMVFQHFVLFDSLTLAENVALGVPDRPLAEVTARMLQLAHRYDLDVDPAKRVHDLSVGERQRVEILRALMTAPRLLILDEPTSVLKPQAIERLFATLSQLASDGVSVLFISHKLDEIRRVTHRCVVLRGGRLVASVDPRQESEASLARLMIGADPPAIAAHESPPGAVALSVSGLDTTHAAERQNWLHGIDLDVHSGEIVGIAGVSGNGQAALMAALSGEWTDVKGSIRLFGAEVVRLATRPRRALGLRYVPEERLGHAAVTALSLQDNVVLTRDELRARGFVHAAASRRLAATLIERFGVKATGPAAAAGSLSGGNLQKFIVGREIEAQPRVLLVNQPTWGVDVGAAATIRNELIALRKAGCAVLVVSEDLDELFELSDRLFVMSKGRLSPGVRPGEISVQDIGRWMSGLWPQPEVA